MVALLHLQNRKEELFITTRARPALQSLDHGVGTWPKPANQSFLEFLKFRAERQKPPLPLLKALLGGSPECSVATA